MESSGTYTADCATSNEMLKRRARPPSPGLPLLAEEIDALATLMGSTAERMEYFGGFDREMRRHARELAGAATIARGWAKALRARQAALRPRGG